MIIAFLRSAMPAELPLATTLGLFSAARLATWRTAGVPVLGPLRG